jgi:hypothetical protein
MMNLDLGFLSTVTGGAIRIKYVHKDRTPAPDPTVRPQPAPLPGVRSLTR